MEGCNLVLFHFFSFFFLTFIFGPIPVATFGGYHSLDRKSHLSEYYNRENSPNRLGVFDRTAMAALLSPRRVPQPPPDSMQRHSVSGKYHITFQVFFSGPQEVL